MKTEVLLRSIGKINDELIADAESEANTKRKPGWAKFGKPVSEGNGTDIQEPVINRKSCLRLADSSFYFNILYI